MPRRRVGSSRRTVKKQLGPKKPRLKALSLLILECDANKLKAQSLAVADELNAVVRLLPANLTVELASINAAADLTERFVDYAQRI